MYPSRLCRVMKDQIQAGCAITGRRVNKVRSITRHSFGRPLKIVQEGEQRISWPVAASPAATWRCLGERLFFHGECRSQVDLSCLDRFMSEPQRNDRTIYTLL